MNDASAARTSALLLAVIASIFLLAGCMGDDEATPGETTTTTADETAEASVRAVYDFPHKTPSEVAAFWTKERMEAAKPKELPRVLGAPAAGAPPPADGPPLAVNGGPPGAPPGPLEMRNAAIKPPAADVAPRRAKLKYRRYRWRTSHEVPPAAMWGKFFVDLGRGETEWCSGTVVPSNHRSLVWTAGHCLYDPIEREWFNQNVIFVPGYDSGKAPFGRWVVRTLYVHRKWMRKRRGFEDWGYDFGAVIVEPLNGQSIADVVGWQGIYFNLARKWRYMSGGYPANKPFNGEDLFICDANLGRVDRRFRPPTTGIGCDMTGGSSGGGWLIGLGQQGKGLGWIFGHNSYGPVDRRTRKELPEMYSPYYGKEARAWWQKLAQ